MSHFVSSKAVPAWMSERVAEHAHRRGCGTFDGGANRSRPAPPFRDGHKAHDVVWASVHIADLCGALHISIDQLTELADPKETTMPDATGSLSPGATNGGPPVLGDAENGRGELRGETRDAEQAITRAFKDVGDMFDQIGQIMARMIASLDGTIPVGAPIQHSDRTVTSGNVGKTDSPTGSAEHWKQRFEDLQVEHGKCIASWERIRVLLAGERDDLKIHIKAARAVLDAWDQPDGVGSLIDAVAAALEGRP
jgi:hypothetical protein